MSSSLENEDLDNGPLVRMEDVQPARDRSCEVYRLGDTKNKEVETYIVDLDYDNECVVDDDDSNIGSMVSIHSEEVVECDDKSDLDLIEPDVKPVKATPIKLEYTPKTESKTPPDSWPTLEILPGGVIKHLDKCDEDLSSIYAKDDVDNEREDDGGGGLMYACAKCPQSFKFLFNLVRHVREHEKERKIQKAPDLSKLTPLERELACLKRERLDFDKEYKRQKVDVLARIATAAACIENIKEITRVHSMASQPRSARDRDTALNGKVEKNKQTNKVARKYIWNGETVVTVKTLKRLSKVPMKSKS